MPKHVFFFKQPSVDQYRFLNLFPSFFARVLVNVSGANAMHPVCILYWDVLWQ